MFTRLLAVGVVAGGIYALSGVGEPVRAAPTGLAATGDVPSAVTDVRRRGGGFRGRGFGRQRGFGGRGGFGSTAALAVADLRRTPLCGGRRFYGGRRFHRRSSLRLAPASRQESVPVWRAAVHRLPGLYGRLWIQLRLAMAPLSDHRQPLLVSALGTLPLRSTEPCKEKRAGLRSARCSALGSAMPGSS